MVNNDDLTERAGRAYWRVADARIVEAWQQSRETGAAFAQCLGVHFRWLWRWGVTASQALADGDATCGGVRRAGIRHTEPHAADPLSGHVLVFMNRRRNRIKLLVWDHAEYLVVLRPAEGTFSLPTVWRTHTDARRDRSSRRSAAHAVAAY
jgi:hypothetical protein